MLTKTQAKIMQVFTGQITELFTIRGIARTLKMHVSLAHRAIKPLIKKKLLTLNKQHLLGLNYTENHDVLAYIEYLRRNEFLSKPKNRDIALFVEDVIERIGEDCFVLLLFGSAVDSAKPRDIDILLIVDHIDKVEFHEKFMHNICDSYDLPFHPIVISFESVYEMLAKRDKLNVMNEVLNKHIIMYGAELFYQLIKKGRI